MIVIQYFNVSIVKPSEHCKHTGLSTTARSPTTTTDEGLNTSTPLFTSTDAGQTTSTDAGQNTSTDAEANSETASSLSHTNTQSAATTQGTAVTVKSREGTFVDKGAAVYCNHKKSAQNYKLLCRFTICRPGGRHSISSGNVLNYNWNSNSSNYHSVAVRIQCVPFSGIIKYSILLCLG